MMVDNGSGWWFQPTPLKNMKVSWEYDIHNIWKVINMFQTTNQNRWFVMENPTIRSKWMTWRCPLL